MKTQPKKQGIYLVTLIVLAAVWFTVSCKNMNSEDKKSIEVTVAYQDSLRQDSILRASKIETWNSFKASTEVVLANNQEKIDELRLKIKKSKTPNIDKLRQKKIDELQAENQAIKEKLVALEIKKNDVLLDTEIDAIKAQLNSIEAELEEIN
ncbi:MAG: hypothetical protein H6553_04065 [Chitinophagales bacterium]|nr:hypothetical protein [Chitinophagales bacterium]